MKIISLSSIVFLSFLFPMISSAQTPNLGTASSFAVFTSVGAFNNLGTTNITGNVGTNAGSFTGFPPGVITGQTHITDAVSLQASTDVAIAYAELANKTCGAVITTTLGSNQTLTPNIYCTGAATTLNGDLILDGQGNPNAVFIFQIDGALSTSTFSSITLINSATLCNVFWQVNGAFSLGDHSVFKGTILANGAVSLLEGSALYGQALTKAGAVDLHNNIIMEVAIPVVAAITGNSNVCVGKQTTLSNTTLSGTWLSSNTAVATVTNTGIVSGIASGLSTISYTVANTNGCVTTSTKSITVDALPTAVAAITGTNSVCEASTTQLSTTSTSGVWSSSNTAVATVNTTGLVTGITAGTTIIIYTVTNAAGCVSSNSTIITVKANSTSTNNTSICPSALPFVWNGLTFNTAGTQTAHLTNAAGCDSVATLELTVKTNTTSSTNHTACTSYLWNGTTYTTSGNKTFTSTNAQGCDSVATLGLTINNISTSTTNTSICPSALPFVWNGLTFNTAGTQTSHLTNVAGCDSAATLELTVKTNTISSTNHTACTSYLWNGTTYTTSGTYTFTTTNSQGCDSVATLVLTINNISISTTNTSICPSALPYAWNGLTFNTAGTQTATLVNAVGCDSVATLELTVKTNTISSTNHTACTSYLWNGTTYTTSGTKTFTSTNAQGCDSVATLVLTINNISTSTTNTSICPSALPFVWNGLTFTTAGSQTAHLTNAVGCDSVATLNLTVDNTPATPTITISSTTVVGGQTGVVYTCSTIANATSYTWSYSGTGATITGNGTNTITVNFAPNATSGNMIVVAVNGASCSSEPASVTVTITPLPVVLSSFNAEKLNNTAVVKWTTVTEINSKNFEVQKSIDGKNFFTIEVVEAKGNSTSINNYSIVDGKPVVGINYYRLKQVDNDGRFILSVVKTVKFNSDATFVINIYPNPATDLLNVRLTNGIAKQINILNTLGKIVYSTNVIQTGATQVSIKNLIAGTYFVEIISNENRVVEKFLKN